MVDYSLMLETLSCFTYRTLLLVFFSLTGYPFSTAQVFISLSFSLIFLEALTNTSPSYLYPFFSPSPLPLPHSLLT